MTTAKTAAVFALDVSCAQTLSKGIALCEATALDQMVYSPHAELGLVFAGTDGSANSLHVETNGARYSHISVARTVAPTTLEYLHPLKEAAVKGVQGGVCDMLETIIVCALLLNLRTAKKKYTRTIFLMTDCRHEVSRKEEFTTVLQSLQAEDVSLVVVGIDFTETSARVDSEDWGHLPVKAQNERVLHALCNELGERSLVVSPDEALEGVHMLRRRTVLQRPLLKVSLAIGTVRIATQMFTKASKQVLPTMQRVLASTGENVGLTHEYVRVVGASDGGEEATALANEGGVSAGDGGPRGAGTVVTADQRIKAYYYGRTLIPCTEADLEVMRVSGHRSLSVLGFVSLKDIPPYILMGGTKALLPLAGDLDGQRGFSSLVQAMEAEHRAAVVRFVRTQDAAPALALCVPSHKPGKRDALYFAPLPFAEDARLFRFSEFEDVRCSAAEEALVDGLVDEMTVGKEALRPNETFNPVLAMYYATLKAKALRSATTATGDPAKAVPSPSLSEHDVPPLLPQLSASSTDFTNDTNPISAVLRRAQPKLEACASAFPFVDVAHDADGKLARAYWFRPAANAHGALAGLGGDGAGSEASAPTTLNAFRALHQASGGGKAPDEASETASTASGATTIAANVLEPTVTRVSTINPAHTFAQLIATTRAAAEKGGHDVLAAQQAIMDDLADVILRLLRRSFKDDQYQKCDEGVRALRQFCVEESLPEYYNRFLVQLMLVAQESGHDEGYWHAHVVSTKSMHPITRLECTSSSLADDAAAEAFLASNRALPEIPVDDEPEDDLLDLVS